MREQFGVEREVVIDGNFITSRKPDDLPAFNRALIELLSLPRRSNPKSGAHTLTSTKKIEQLKDKLHIGHSH